MDFVILQAYMYSYFQGRLLDQRQFVKKSQPDICKTYEGVWSWGAQQGCHKGLAVQFGSSLASNNRRCSS